MPAIHPVVLVAHPSTPCAAVRALEVRIEIREVDLLVLDYALQGDIPRLRIPPERTAQRVDELWKHTCFEAFLRTDDSPGYYELNFSPSGEWSAYRFSAYRHGLAPADGVGVPTTSVLASDTALRFEASIPVAAIRECMSPQSEVPLRIALAAVIESHDGKLSYWAQHHAAAKPDFHHPDAFVLEIPHEVRN